MKPRTLFGAAIATGALVSLGFVIARPSSSRRQVAPYPDELIMTQKGGGPLLNSNLQIINYTWSDTNENVVLRGFARNMATAAWSAPIERLESTAFTITAVSPEGIGTSKLYVVGVTDTGNTVIQKWTVTVSFPPGANPQFNIQKVPVNTSPALPLIRACAVPPNSPFLLVQAHPSGSIIKISLPTGNQTTVLTSTNLPGLSQFDVLTWSTHISDGAVFRMNRGRSDPMTANPTLLYMWDNNSDGSFELVEEISDLQFNSRGYGDIASWPLEKTLMGI